MLHFDRCIAVEPLPEDRGIMIIYSEKRIHLDMNMEQRVEVAGSPYPVYDSSIIGNWYHIEGDAAAAMTLIAGDFMCRGFELGEEHKSIILAALKTRAEYLRAKIADGIQS